MDLTPSNATFNQHLQRHTKAFTITNTIINKFTAFSYLKHVKHAVDRFLFSVETHSQSLNFKARCYGKFMLKINFYSVLKLQYVHLVPSYDTTERLIHQQNRLKRGTVNGIHLLVSGKSFASQ